MASLTPLQTMISHSNLNLPLVAGVSSVRVPNCRLPLAGPSGLSWNAMQRINKKRSSMVVAAVGEVSADSTEYLIAGAIGVALIGTAFPILFSRKDT